MNRMLVAFLSMGLGACTMVGPGPVGPSAPPPGAEPPAGETQASEASGQFGDLPRTGGENPDGAQAVDATAVVEGVVEPGQQLWYRFEPAVAKGRCAVKVSARQLMHGSYEKRAFGKVDLTDAEMTSVGGSTFDTGHTVSDGTFQGSGSPNYLTRPASFMKVEMKDNGAAPVHFRIKLCEGQRS